MLTGVVVLHTQPQISLPPPLPPHILPHPLSSKATHPTALKRDVMVSTLESLHHVSAFMDYPPSHTGNKEVSTFNAFNVDLDGSWFVSLFGDGCCGMPNLTEVVFLISWGCLSG